MSAHAQRFGLSTAALATFLALAVVMGGFAYSVTPITGTSEDTEQAERVAVGHMESAEGEATLWYKSSGREDVQGTLEVSYLVTPSTEMVVEYGNVKTNTYVVATGVWNEDGTLVGCFVTADGTEASTLYPEMNQATVALIDCDLDDGVSTTPIKKGNLTWSFGVVFLSVGYQTEGEPILQRLVKAVHDSLVWAVSGALATSILVGVLCTAGGPVSAEACVLLVGIGVATVFGIAAVGVVFVSDLICKEFGGDQVCSKAKAYAFLNGKKIIRGAPTLHHLPMNPCGNPDGRDTWNPVEEIFYNQRPGSLIGVEGPYDSSFICDTNVAYNTFIGMTGQHQDGVDLRRVGTEVLSPGDEGKDYRFTLVGSHELTWEGLQSSTSWMMWALGSSPPPRTGITSGRSKPVQRAMCER